MAFTFVPKPWNDPWIRRALADPTGAYKQYCYGTRKARNYSWRQLKKYGERRFAAAIDRSQYPGSGS